MTDALAKVAAQASAAYELLLSSAMETVLRFGSLDQAGLCSRFLGCLRLRGSNSIARQSSSAMKSPWCLTAGIVEPVR